jgi:hypothetical protein
MEMISKPSLVVLPGIFFLCHIKFFVNFKHHKGTDWLTEPLIPQEI